MKLLKAGLLFIFALLTFTGGVYAQTTYAEALQTALASGNYLDAFDQVFMLNDSAPAQRDAILSAEPGDDVAAQARTFLLLFSEQPELALAEAEALPESPFTYAMIAAANDMLGNANAAATFDMALQQISATEMPFGDLVDGHLLAGSTQRRIAHEAQFYGLMAAVNFAKFNPERLLEYSNHVIQLYPDLANARRLRGVGNLWSGDPEAALADVTRAIELDPSTYYFRFLHARIQNRLGNPEAALSEVEAALTLEPQSAEAHVLRADINMAMGNTQQGLNDFGSFIELRTGELLEGETLLPEEEISLPMTFGRTFHLPFEADAGETITISITSVNPDEVDPMTLLLNPEGVPVAFSDDDEESLNALIADYQADESGTYTLVVSHAYGGSEGDITVSLSLNNAS